MLRTLWPFSFGASGCPRLAFGHGGRPLGIGTMRWKRLLPTAEGKEAYHLPNCYLPTTVPDCSACLRLAEEPLLATRRSRSTRLLASPGSYVKAGLQRRYFRHFGFPFGRPALPMLEWGIGWIGLGSRRGSLVESRFPPCAELAARRPVSFPLRTKEGSG